MKFYGKTSSTSYLTDADIAPDLVVGVDEHQSTFCVALVCNRETTSKILRTSVSDCPVKATHTMVNQLQKDTMPLLSTCRRIQNMNKLVLTINRSGTRCWKSNDWPTRVYSRWQRQV